jgi:hypothetical protein
MRKWVLSSGLIYLSLLAVSGTADEKKGPESPLLGYLAGQGYDEAAAREFGGDESGIREYVMAFLKRGSSRLVH